MARLKSPMQRKKKQFDAVKASRQWRIETGRELAAMTTRQRIEFLNRRRAQIKPAETHTTR
ncbi:MAG: hypothetical protein WA117_07560 [Verrucomicrobiia bacterium]